MVLNDTKIPASNNKSKKTITKMTIKTKRTKITRLVTLLFR